MVDWKPTAIVARFAAAALWCTVPSQSGKLLTYSPTTRNRGFSISPTALIPARSGASIRWA